MASVHENTVYKDENAVIQHLANELSTPTPRRSPGTYSGRGQQSRPSTSPFTSPAPAVQLLERFGITPTPSITKAIHGAAEASTTTSQSGRARNPVPPPEGKETPWTPNGPNNTHVPYMRMKLNPLFADLVDPKPVRPARGAAATATAAPAWRPGGGGSSSSGAAGTGGYASRAAAAAAARARATSRQTSAAAAGLRDPASAFTSPTGDGATSSGDGAASTGGISPPPGQRPGSRVPQRPGAIFTTTAASPRSPSPALAAVPKRPAASAATASPAGRGTGTSAGTIANTPSVASGSSTPTTAGTGGAGRTARALSYSEWADAQARSPSLAQPPWRTPGDRQALPRTSPPPPPSRRPQSTAAAAKAGRAADGRRPATATSKSPTSRTPAPVTPPGAAASGGGAAAKARPAIGRAGRVEASPGGGGGRTATVGASEPPISPAEQLREPESISLRASRESSSVNLHSFPSITTLATGRLRPSVRQVSPMGPGQAGGDGGAVRRGTFAGDPAGQPVRPDVGRGQARERVAGGQEVRGHAGQEAGRAPANGRDVDAGGDGDGVAGESVFGLPRALEAQLLALQGQNGTAAPAAFSAGGGEAAEASEHVSPGLRSDPAGAAAHIPTHERDVRTVGTGTAAVSSGSGGYQQRQPLQSPLQRPHSPYAAAAATASAGRGGHLPQLVGSDTETEIDVDDDDTASIFLDDVVRHASVTGNVMYTSSTGQMHRINSNILRRNVTAHGAMSGGVPTAAAPPMLPRSVSARQPQAGTSAAVLGPQIIMQGVLPGGMAAMAGGDGGAADMRAWLETATAYADGGPGAPPALSGSAGEPASRPATATATTTLGMAAWSGGNPGGTPPQASSGRASRAGGGDSSGSGASGSGRSESAEGELPHAGAAAAESRAHSAGSQRRPGGVAEAVQTGSRSAAAAAPAGLVEAPEAAGKAVRSFRLGFDSEWLSEDDEDAGDEHLSPVAGGIGQGEQRRTGGGAQGAGVRMLSGVTPPDAGSFAAGTAAKAANNGPATLTGLPNSVAAAEDRGTILPPSSPPAPGNDPRVGQPGNSQNPANSHPLPSGHPPRPTDAPDSATRGPLPTSKPPLPPGAIRSHSPITNRDGRSAGRGAVPALAVDGPWVSGHPISPTYPRPALIGRHSAQRQSQSAPRLGSAAAGRASTISSAQPSLSFIPHDLVLEARRSAAHHPSLGGPHRRSSTTLFAPRASYAAGYPSLLSSVLSASGAGPGGGGEGAAGMRGSISGASNFSALSGPQAGDMYNYPSHGYMERAAEFGIWEASMLYDLDLYDSLQISGGFPSPDDYDDPSYVMRSLSGAAAAAVAATAAAGGAISPAGRPGGAAGGLARSLATPAGRRAMAAWASAAAAAAAAAASAGAAGGTTPPSKTGAVAGSGVAGGPSAPPRSDTGSGSRPRQTTRDPGAPDDVPSAEAGRGGDAGPVGQDRPGSHAAGRAASGSSARGTRAQEGATTGAAAAAPASPTGVEPPGDGATPMANAAAGPGLAGPGSQRGPSGAAPRSALRGSPPRVASPAPGPDQERVGVTGESMLAMLDQILHEDPSAVPGGPGGGTGTPGPSRGSSFRRVAPGSGPGPSPTAAAALSGPAAETAPAYGGRWSMKRRPAGAPADDPSPSAGPAAAATGNLNPRSPAAGSFRSPPQDMARPLSPPRRSVSPALRLPNGEGDSPRFPVGSMDVQSSADNLWLPTPPPPVRPPVAAGGSVSLFAAELRASQISSGAGLPTPPAVAVANPAQHAADTPRSQAVPETPSPVNAARGGSGSGDSSNAAGTSAHPHHPYQSHYAAQGHRAQQGPLLLHQLVRGGHLHGGGGGGAAGWQAFPGGGGGSGGGGLPPTIPEETLSHPLSLSSLVSPSSSTAGSAAGGAGLYQQHHQQPLQQHQLQQQQQHLGPRQDVLAPPVLPPQRPHPLGPHPQQQTALAPPSAPAPQPAMVPLPAALPSGPPFAQPPPLSSQPTLLLGVAGDPSVAFKVPMLPTYATPQQEVQSQSLQCAAFSPTAAATVGVAAAPSSAPPARAFPPAPMMVSAAAAQAWGRAGSSASAAGGLHPWAASSSSGTTTATTATTMDYPSEATAALGPPAAPSPLPSLLPAPQPSFTWTSTGPAVAVPGPLFPPSPLMPPPPPPPSGMPLQAVSQSPLTAAVAEARGSTGGSESPFMMPSLSTLTALHMLPEGTTGDPDSSLGGPLGLALHSYGAAAAAATAAAVAQQQQQHPPLRPHFSQRRIPAPAAREAVASNGARAYYPPPSLESIQRLLESNLPPPAIAAAVAVLAGSLPRSAPPPGYPVGPSTHGTVASAVATEQLLPLQQQPQWRMRSSAVQVPSRSPSGGASVGADGGGGAGGMPGRADAETQGPGLGAQGEGVVSAPPMEAAGVVSGREALSRSYAALLTLAGERGMPPKPLQDEEGGGVLLGGRRDVFAAGEVATWGARAAADGEETRRLQLAGRTGLGALAEGPLVRAVRLLAQSMLIVLAGAAGATAAASSANAIFVRPEDLPYEHGTSIYYVKQQHSRQKRSSRR